MGNNLYRSLEVGWTALKLGLTSFGGPIAHIGYFREQYVMRKKWLSDDAFGDLTALCQFLPGPASSQLGIAIGIKRAGLLGGLLAWLGFTLPSALLLVAFAFGMQGSGFVDTGWLQGLKLAAVAVVAQAVWSMSRTLTPDRPRILMAAFTASFALLIPGTIGQLAPIILCGIAGAWMVKPMPVAPSVGEQKEVRWLIAWLSLIIFASLLVILPLIAASQSNPLFQLADIGYRAGSLVFGGGHVVLPMLHENMISTGLVNDQQFMAGYGAAQAVPGPLFTFAAYIGAVSASGMEGIIRAAVILGFIFLPSFLLVVGVMPFWSKLRTHRVTRAVLAGVNASVVGILLAALYDPVWTSTVKDKMDFVFVLIGFLLIVIWRCPPWLLVMTAAAGGWILLT
ncbi:chromate efflux transporter [Cohnella sp.]|uniref:chromate efflux transporter n=1 Tax=Cohnella sp. TaxID=1883426 RepID=UPI003561E680